MKAFYVQKAPKQPFRSYTVMVIAHYRLTGPPSGSPKFQLQLIPYSEVPNGI